MKHIHRVALTLSVIAVIGAVVGCEKTQTPRVETYYDPVLEGLSASLPSCTRGQAVSFRMEPSGPTFAITPQSSQLYRKQLTLIVSAGGPEQPDVGDLTVICRTALLTTSGSAYPPTTSDGSYTEKSCGTDAVLGTNNIQAQSIVVRFDSANELGDVVDLKLPEVRSTMTGTLYPSVTLQLRKVQVQECPIIKGFR